MMKIQYIGKYPAVTDGIGEHQVNEIVTVPRELGERLIRQRNWQKPVGLTKTNKINKKEEEVR